MFGKLLNIGKTIVTTPIKIVADVARETEEALEEIVEEIKKK